MSRELKINSLLVCGGASPIGVSPDRQPFFSWTLTHESPQAVQTSFRLVLLEKLFTPSLPAKSRYDEIWDSGKVETGATCAALPDAVRLSPMTSYVLRLECQSSAGASAKAETSFETSVSSGTYGENGNAGEADSFTKNGALRICRPGKCLFSDKMTSFSFEAAVRLKKDCSSAGIVFCSRASGREDFADASDCEYFLLSLSASKAPSVLLSAVTVKNGNAVFDNVAAFTSAPDSAENKVVYSPELESVFAVSGAYDAHKLFIASESGTVTIKIDGKTICAPGRGVSICGGPGRKDGAPPALRAVGFYSGAGDTAFFSDAAICGEFVFPVDINGIFSDDIRRGRMGVSDGKYRIFGGKDGKAVFTDPSGAGMVIMRSEHVIAEMADQDTVYALPVEARLYFASPCGYEIYCNGEKITPQPVYPVTKDASCVPCAAFDLDAIASSSRELALGILLFGGNFETCLYSFVSLLRIRYSDGSEKIFPSVPEKYKFFEPPFRRVLKTGDKKLDISSLSRVRDYSIPGFDDDRWQSASPSKLRPEKLMQELPEVYSRKYYPKKLSEKHGENGYTVYDFGALVYGYFSAAPSHQGFTVKLISESGYEAASTADDPFTDCPGFIFDAGEETGERCETAFFPCAFRYAAVFPSSEAEYDAEAVLLSSLGAPPAFVCDNKNVNKLVRNAQRTLSDVSLLLPSVLSELAAAHSKKELVFTLFTLSSSALICDAYPMLRASLSYFTSSRSLRGESAFIRLVLALSLSRITEDPYYLLAARIARRDAVSEAESFSENVREKAEELSAPEMFDLFIYHAAAAGFAAEACGDPEAERAAAVLEKLKNGFSEFFSGEKAVEARIRGEIESLSAYALPAFTGLFKNELYAVKRVSEILSGFLGDPSSPVPPQFALTVLEKLLCEKSRGTQSEEIFLCARRPLWASLIASGNSVLKDGSEDGADPYRETGGCSIPACFPAVSAAEVFAGIRQPEIKNGSLVFRIKPYKDFFSRLKTSVKTPFGDLSVGWSQKNSVTRFVTDVPRGCTVVMELDKAADVRPFDRESDVRISGSSLLLYLGHGRHEFQVLY